jgi:hypothetical protein
MTRLTNFEKSINTQIETINLQESLDEVLISINSLVHDSKAIIRF